MKASISHSWHRLSSATVMLIGLASLAAQAGAAVPNPCSLVTVAEMQQIVGPLSEPPRASEPASGENTCSFSPANGPRFIDVTLHEGDLAALKNSASYKNAQALPEFGKDAFVSPDFQDYADLYAKKGQLIVRVTLPKGPKSVETAKSIARKALARL